MIRGDLTDQSAGHGYIRDEEISYKSSLMRQQHFGEPAGLSKRDSLHFSYSAI
jgi:hypothetical protein